MIHAERCCSSGVSEQAEGVPMIMLVLSTEVLGTTDVLLQVGWPRCSS